MEQYFSATQRMEQEVMFPSLLRGVFPQQQQQQQQQQHGEAADADGHADLYERYQQLKAIKPMVEKGLASVNDQNSSSSDADTAEVEGVDGNLEERLSHHVNGLQQVLTDLTKNTKALTRRYSQILEEINLSDDQPSS
ncbi:mid1-interacting protein 1A-like [Guaruba guarouba]